MPLFAKEDLPPSNPPRKNATVAPVVQVPPFAPFGGGRGQGRRCFFLLGAVLRGRGGGGGGGGIDVAVAFGLLVCTVIFDFVLLFLNVLFFVLVLVFVGGGGARVVADAEAKAEPVQQAQGGRRET